MGRVISVVWGDRLEELADALFDALHPEPDEHTDVWRQPCIVVNSPTAAGWLKQHFLFNRRGKGRQRVLANIDIQYLYVFVNDWLARLDSGTEQKRREPRFHPYSVPCLRWRLFRLLGEECPQQLKHYIEGAAADRRRFDLAGVLAKLFDDYQVYRPDMLTDWEKPFFDSAELNENAWQCDLWRRLVESNPTSYLSLFNKISAQHIAETGLKQRYTGVHVFGVSAMPPVYLHFFQQAAESGVQVKFYTFNPCGSEYWEKDVSKKEKQKILCSFRGKELEEETLYLEVGNPLLSSLGKGLQFYLEELIERTDWEPVGASAEAKLPDDTLLHVLQNDIRLRRAVKPAEEGKSEEAAAGRDKTILPREKIERDDSIQFHICHSPWREVEVLKDCMLKWFAADANLQPRHIQVLVSDMETYSPYIDAVFATQLASAADTIPYVVCDRRPSAMCLLADAFVNLIKLPGCRFEASAVMSLLDMEAIREAAGVSAEAVARMRRWVREAGIRWSRDAGHAGSVLGDDAAGAAVAVASWRAGLDRLLAGYAIGSGAAGSAEVCEPVELGLLGKVPPVHIAEGGETAQIGRLAAFFERLERLVEEFSVPCNADEWTKRLTNCLDEFFAANNRTCRDVAILQRAVRDFARTVREPELSEKEKISFDLAAAAIEQLLADLPEAADLVRNAVVFSSLRLMRAVPRRIICLLGLNDGVFPRSDLRSSFDLMGQKPRRCDRSDRLDDRLAFLEALMCSRDRLYISWCGRDARSNDVLPPSTVVAELRDYLAESFDMPAPEKTDKNQELYCFETLHRLQPFHYLYFAGKEAAQGNELFSYSYSNLEAALTLQAASEKPPPSSDGSKTAVQPQPAADAVAPGKKTPPCRTISYEELLRFLKNPAKTFYTQTLLLKFDDEEEILSDRECLGSEALERYKVNEAIVNSLLKLDSPEIPSSLLQDLHISLSAKGLVPPGTPGELRLKKTAIEIKEWLEKEVADLGMSRKELFVQQQKAALKSRFPVELTLDQQPKALVVGAFKVIVPDAAGAGEFDYLNVSWRYADPKRKAKDLMAGYLAHLLIAASGKRVKTLVFTKNKTFAFSKPATEEAKQTLAKIVEHYLAARERLIPFAPESSYAFAEAETKRPKPGEKPPDPDAEASKEWKAEYGWSESQDPYLFRAFGEEGPMAHKQEFKTLTNDLYRPILESAQAGKAKEEEAGSDTPNEDSPEEMLAEPTPKTVKKSRKKGPLHE